MNITVTFNNLDEVKDFAAMFGSQTSETKTTEPVIPPLPRLPYRLPPPHS